MCHSGAKVFCGLKSSSVLAQITCPIEASTSSTCPRPKPDSRAWNFKPTSPLARGAEPPKPKGDACRRLVASLHLPRCICIAQSQPARSTGGCEKTAECSLARPNPPLWGTAMWSGLRGHHCGECVLSLVLCWFLRRWDLLGPREIAIVLARGRSVRRVRRVRRVHQAESVPAAPTRSNRSRRSAPERHRATFLCRKTRPAMSSHRQAPPKPLQPRRHQGLMKGARWETVPSWLQRWCRSVCSCVESPRASG